VASAVTVDQINAFLAGEFGGTRNRCEQVGDATAVAVLEADASSLRPGGIISGPSVFGVCDAALFYAAFTVIGVEPMTLTSEMSIRFLRPARGHTVRARATLQYAGRRSLIGTVVAWTDDEARPVAVAQGTYVRPSS
jgi:acyl-coenzyme A thioesterase PaaI-like protein